MYLYILLESKSSFDIIPFIIGIISGIIIILLAILYKY